LSFKLGRTRIEVFTSIRLCLLRKLHHWHMRSDVLSEPSTVDAKVVVGDACANPATPPEVLRIAHNFVMAVRLRK
jgi:hypothetical protein